MTQDEIIEMARQAGIDEWWDSGNEQREVLQEHLVAFAKLVAMRTLEGNYNEMIDIVCKHEREACAKVTEDAWMAFSHASVSHDAVNPFPELKFAATAIRARGET